MSHTGYTDDQAKRADIAAQIVGFLRASNDSNSLSYGLKATATRLIAAYDATFDAPTEPKKAA